MSAWLSLNGMLTTGNVDSYTKFVGALPSHDFDTRPVQIVPYFNPGTDFTIPSNARYPDPSPNHEVDSLCIALIRMAPMTRVTWKMWNELRSKHGIKRTVTYTERRNLRSVDLGFERHPFTVVDRDAKRPEKYVGVAQELYDRYFKGTLLYDGKTQECAFSLMKPEEGEYKTYTRGYNRYDREKNEPFVRLHPEYLKNASDGNIFETVLHEIAHALRWRIKRKLQVRDGHDWMWQQIYLKIGGDGSIRDDKFTQVGTASRIDCVYVCRNETRENIKCAFRISKYKIPFEYDDSYTELIGSDGCCALHHQTFQRLTAEAPVDVEISKSDTGVVTITKDDVMLASSKHATECLVDALTEMRDAAKETEFCTELVDFLNVVGVELERHRNATTIRDLYAVKIPLDRMCLSYLDLINSYDDTDVRKQIYDATDASTKITEHYAFALYTIDPKRLVAFGDYERLKKFLVRQGEREEELLWKQRGREKRQQKKMKLI